MVLFFIIVSYIVYFVKDFPVKWSYPKESGESQNEHVRRGKKPHCGALRRKENDDQ